MSVKTNKRFTERLIHTVKNEPIIWIGFASFIIVFVLFFIGLIHYQNNSKSVKYNM